MLFFIPTLSLPSALQESSLCGSPKRGQEYEPYRASSSWVRQMEAQGGDHGVPGPLRLL